MRTVTSRHRREVDSSVAAIDHRFSRLGTEADDLWPSELWFPMRLDSSPDAGGSGGHGPVRYHCSAREPESVTFTFDSVFGSTRWVGWHRFHVQATTEGALVEHLIELELPTWQYLQWKVLVEPLHDALIENLFEKAARLSPTPNWSGWVRLLRRIRPAIRGDQS